MLPPSGHHCCVHQETWPTHPLGHSDPQALLHARLPAGLQGPGVPAPGPGRSRPLGNVCHLNLKKNHLKWVSQLYLIKSTQNDLLGEDGALGRAGLGQVGESNRHVALLPTGMLLQLLGVPTEGSLGMWWALVPCTCIGARMAPVTAEAPVL